MPYSILTVLTLVFAGLITSAVIAQESYESWDVLRNPFPSTGGNGVMIDGYSPMVIGDKCVTKFTAIEPNGVVHRNKIAFDTVAVQGGILCTNGKWEAEDGTASGTTPFRVFIKDGIVRRAP